MTELVVVWNGVNDGHDGDLLVPVNWADPRSAVGWREPGERRMRRERQQRQRTTRKYLQGFRNRVEAKRRAA